MFLLMERRCAMSGEQIVGFVVFGFGLSFILFGLGQLCRCFTTVVEEAVPRR